MISVFAKVGDRLDRQIGGAEVALPAEALWVDLYEPTRDEEKAVEKLVGFNIPTREEMQEIEASSRLRHEDHGIFMTVTVVTNMSGPYPSTSAITFILAAHRLITIRYSDPLPFKLYGGYAVTHPATCTSGEAMLAGLLEAMVDRMADILELAGQDVEALSHEIFSPEEKRHGPKHFQGILQRIGKAGDIASKVRESVQSLSRSVSFLGIVAPGVGGKQEKRSRLKMMARDLQSLADYSNFLSGKVTFLLDATLGMLNIEQNNIIKIFSIAAVVFLPPTLVATVYGMNFHFMPELDWPWGYPVALVLMLISAVLPYWIFKKKGWM